MVVGFFHCTKTPKAIGRKLDLNHGNTQINGVEGIFPGTGPVYYDRMNQYNRVWKRGSGFYILGCGNKYITIVGVQRSYNYLKFMYHTEISIVVVYLFICIAVDQLIDVYYPHEVSSANRIKPTKYCYSWVVKIRNTLEAVLRPQYTPWPLY